MVVGATEYAALIYWGFTPIAVPEAIRFELTGALKPWVTAKDVILHILRHFDSEDLRKRFEITSDSLTNLWFVIEREYADLVHRASTG